MSNVTESLFTVNDNNNNASLKEQNMAKLLEEIYSTNNLDIKTDLNQKQVNAITKGKLFATTFNCDIMMNLCNLHETLLISKNRAGRKEFIEMSKSVTSADTEESTVRERLLGK
jgi:hypothetical protein